MKKTFDNHNIRHVNKIKLVKQITNYRKNNSVLASSNSSE